MNKLFTNSQLFYSFLYPFPICLDSNYLITMLKFIYSEKATKFCKISTLLLAFSEYMNFTERCYIDYRVMVYSTGVVTVELLNFYFEWSKLARFSAKIQHTRLLGNSYILLIPYVGLYKLWLIYHLLYF